VVNLGDQTRFYKRMQSFGLCEKIELHGAKHEVFFESDLMRNTAISGFMSFFERQL
jgi:alpha-beta hydrolase superfamily lysophospholipase